MKLWLAVVLVCYSLGLSRCLSYHQGPMDGEPADALFSQITDTRVRYTDTGSGPTVVLVHGFASSLETWVDVASVLAKTHRVIALDLKGFGWTDRPEGDYSPAAQAELVFGLLNQLGVDTFAVVAHSWGSSVALTMALKAPERITKIALYDAWVYEDQLPSFFLWARTDGIGELLFAMFYDERPDERLARAFYDPAKLTESLVEAVERSLKRPGTRAAALAAVRGQRFEALSAQFPEIHHEVLLLWGENDLVTPVDIGERLNRDIPNSRLIRYSRCGHFPMIEAQAASTSDLAEFLRETRVTETP